jgi:hypothetical protein
MEKLGYVIIQVRQLASSYQVAHWGMKTKYLKLLDFILFAGHPMPLIFSFPSLPLFLLLSFFLFCHILSPLSHSFSFLIPSSS